MSLEKVYAQLNCSDLTASLGWFEGMFGRSADARPMPGLAEWHHGESAGLQVFEAPEHAGHGTLTIIVRNLAGEHARLADAGLSPGRLESATTTSLVRLRDPDGNLIVLAEPSR